MNISAFLNTVTTRSRTLPLVILYVTEGCNLQCTMCSYREPLPNELSLKEIEQLAKALVAYGLRHIVFSGGEPLLRRDFDQICDIFASFNVRQTLLTNGLLLEKRMSLLSHFADVIVSLDGPNAETHDSIRGIRSFDQIVLGLKQALRSSNRPRISIRTVIQKKNYRFTSEMVDFAKTLGLDRISFLAADVLSSAFARDYRGTVAENHEIMLDDEDIRSFWTIIGKMIPTFEKEFETRFIAESPEKLCHIAQYFEALLGKAPFPRNRCNAPMVSAVITSTGAIQPCFFLPSFGNTRTDPLVSLLTSDRAQLIRQGVKHYQFERCKTCVCTLHINPLNALFDRF